MYLNALLESSIGDDNRLVVITCSGGTYCGRIMAASLEGEMFGLSLHRSRESIYIAKSTVHTVKFVDEFDVQQESQEEE